jgi:hypothetical protein
VVQEHLYHYHIDEEGYWFCEGRPVSDPELVAVLGRSLLEKDGRYFIHCEGEAHPVTVADAPLVVRHVHLRHGRGPGLEAVEIELRDGRRELLDAGTLEISTENILYCRATRSRLRARFARSAYYELMRHLQMEGEFERFYIEIKGHRRYITGAGRESGRSSETGETESA